MSWIDEATVKLKEEQEQERLDAIKKHVRNERDRLLKECDYIVMPDYPMADKSAWESYRQILRDITDQVGFPEEVTWPTKPE